MALLLVELGSQSAEILGILRLLVGFTGDALSGAFLVVEAICLVRLRLPSLHNANPRIVKIWNVPLPVLLLPAFDIPVPISVLCSMFQAENTGLTNSF